MSDVRRLRASSARIESVDPASEPARWCVAQYFAELARRFDDGFNPGQSLPADDVELRPPRGDFLVAIIDGAPVACGAIKGTASGVGSLKRMWVAESERGLGFGHRMLAALEARARELGFTTLRFETNRSLVEAIQMYRTAGYVEVPAFNDERYADHWFEKQLR